ncbi:Zinc finger protein [Nymphaea thermarum]|nr:Zinc finger protein [Nymphaea thermarum]
MVFRRREAAALGGLPGRGDACMEAQGCAAGPEKPAETGIKLKIKMGSRDPAEGEDGSLPESETVSGYSTGDDACIRYACKVCNRSFSSGRALGAHMRVHSGTATERCPPTACAKGDDVTTATKTSVSAAHRQNRQPNRRHQHIEEENMATEGSAKAQSVLKRKPSSTCVLCKKRFPSMKSLFGHMRCHPDRDWRGIQPPEKLQSSPSSTVSESEPNSPALPPDKPIGMASWPVTVRRRKRSMAEAGMRDEFDDPVYHAAYDLLLLKNSTNPGGSDLSASQDGDAEYDEDGPDGRASKRRRKKKKIRALMDPSGKYRCTTCHKSFSSHQALGGHRTSHKNIKEELPNGETGEREVAEPPPAHPWPEFDDDEVPTHQCQICFKSFPSGQALGGHKRCHWIEDRAAAAIMLEAAESSSIATTTSEEQKRSSILPGFDLNEVAPLEDADLDSLYSMVDVVPAAAKLLGIEGSTHCCLSDS